MCHFINVFITNIESETEIVIHSDETTTIHNENLEKSVHIKIFLYVYYYDINYYKNTVVVLKQFHLIFTKKK